MLLNNVKEVDLPKVDLGLVSEVRIDRVAGDNIEVSFIDPAVSSSYPSSNNNKPSASTAIKTMPAIPESGVQLKQLKCGMKFNGTGADQGQHLI